MARKRTHREAPDMAAFVSRVARGMVKRADEGDLEVLSALRQMRADIDAAIDAAARSLHEQEDGYSWTAIGAEMGISRQAARQQFSRQVPVVTQAEETA